MTPLEAALGALAVYRATLLVVADKVTQRPRGWLRARFPRRLGYLLICPWCASVWVAAAAAGAWVLLPSRWWTAGAAVLAWSAAAGILASHWSPPAD